MTTKHCINEDQLQDKIVTSINNIAKNEGFVNHKKYIRAISTNGGNYLGELFEVDIKDEDKELNLFIKQIKQDGLPDFFNIKQFQEREILVYVELATLYTQLMNGANIPERERYQQPKCYDATYEFIILENLSVKGYETLERTEPITLQFAELAIKQLARFHALSFVLKVKKPEYFNGKLKQLQSSFNFTSNFFKVLNDSFDVSYRLLDENREKRLRAAYEKIMKVEKYYGESSSPKCLCHGDFRSNNMLILQEEDTITNMVTVDYQMTHFGNPMNEFWYLLIIHTDREFRRKHLTTLKELYYDTLTQFLKYFAIDVSNVYPRKEFEVDYKEQTIFGLYSTVLGLSFIFSTEDSLLDVNDLNSIKDHVKLQDCAKDRLEDIVQDFIDWGII